MDTINPNMMVTTQHKSPLGPVVGVIVILALLLIGGFYFWGEKKNSQPVVTPVINENSDVDSINAEDQAMIDEQAEKLQTLSYNDDLASIEADLNATDLTNIEEGLDDI